MNSNNLKPNLTKEQYGVLREKRTEAPFSGEYDKHFEKGMYKCVGCGQKLFSSDKKYDSGSGWPSFVEAVDGGAVDLIEDNSHGMKRVEVVCKKCGGHLGHVFSDGPKTVDDGRKASGDRYCINSAALDFMSSGKEEASE